MQFFFFLSPCFLEGHISSLSKTLTLEIEGQYHGHGDWKRCLHVPNMHHREGNGNPLQYPCLENPMDGEAWWAAIYGAPQSQTRLKRLSSSSSSRALRSTREATAMRSLFSATRESPCTAVKTQHSQNKYNLKEKKRIKTRQLFSPIRLMKEESLVNKVEERALSNTVNTLSLWTGEVSVKQHLPKWAGCLPSSQHHFLSAHSRRWTCTGLNQS